MLETGIKGRQDLRVTMELSAKAMGSGGLEHFPEEDPNIPQFTLEELQAGVAAAHDLGRDCAVHAYSNEGIRRAVLAGVDNIEHGCMMTEEMGRRLRSSPEKE